MTPKFEKTRSTDAELAGTDVIWQAIIYSPVLIAPHLSTHHHQTLGLVLCIVYSCNTARGKGELSGFQFGNNFWEPLMRSLMWIPMS